VRISFIFPLFLTCSLQVSDVFPIGPGFNPISFAQSPPLFTYIAGPKGEALHLSIEPSIWGINIVSTFICDGPVKLVQKKS
jgi:hypothetical protein